MSHSAERKEKDCLNCGTIVAGKYCQVCGQENVAPKETFWSMVMHFFGDITHFDGKFFTTLKDLLFKPGFLSAEYIKGRRQRYLHPVRMYVFTSAIFFLVFFSIRGTEDVVKFNGDDPMTMQQRDSMIARLERKVKRDNADVKSAQQIAILSDTTRQVRPSELLPYQGGFTVMSTIGGDYRDRAQYDSLQRVLPAAQRDGFFTRIWNKKSFELNEKYKYDPKSSMQKTMESILHKLPYLLFVSLPFFALILKLLYVRRKQFYYADHAIFTIHHYILSFILLLLVFLWSRLDDLNGWGIWDILTFFTIILWPIYLYVAMRRFYRQGWFKTFVKFFLLNIIGLVILIVLFVIFSLFSIFQL